MLGVDAINSVLTANSKESLTRKKEREREKGDTQKYNRKTKELEGSRLTGLRIRCRLFRSLPADPEARWRRQRAVISGVYR